MATVLIIEDEAAVASALAEVCRRIGLAPITAASAAKGLQALTTAEPALVLLDIGLPDQSGMAVLEQIRKTDQELPVLVITAHCNLQNAVDAKKQGASDYLVKPINLRDLEATIRTLLATPPQAVLAPAAPAGIGRAPLLIGSSAAMQPAFTAIAHACASDVPVLITGPTGIGKSLTARIVHLHSERHAAPFITLSCASLPAELLEAELFGHERGAFTGAIGHRTGHVERAAGGTLFLDEIGELPLALQVKLLRVVEDKTFVRVGGREDIEVDLRIIAATNQDLDAAVADKRFREDLLYRLRVLEVLLPPLSQRQDDLPALCSYLLAEIAGNRQLTLAEDALQAIATYAWPGNVRELRNVLERATVVCNGAIIRLHHLPDAVQPTEPSHSLRHTAAIDMALTQWTATRLQQGCDYQQLHDELEGKLLATLLPHYGGKPTVLANALNMNRATLRRKLRDLLDEQGSDDNTVQGPN